MNLPIALTLCRIVLVPLIIVFLISSSRVHVLIAAVIFIAASLTDWLDGRMARRWNQVTRLGTLLDPVADKLLVAAALVALVQIDMIDAWIAVAIIGRELAVTGLRGVALSMGIVMPGLAARQGQDGVAVRRAHRPDPGEGRAGRLRALPPVLPGCPLGGGRTDRAVGRASTSIASSCGRARRCSSRTGNAGRERARTRPPIPGWRCPRVPDRCYPRRPDRGAAPRRCGHPACWQREHRRDQRAEDPREAAGDRYPPRRRRQGLPRGERGAEHSPRGERRQAPSSPIVGNCWPVFLRFRGGKGVATGFGAFLALTPWATAARRLGLARRHGELSVRLAGVDHGLPVPAARRGCCSATLGPASAPRSSPPSSSCCATARISRGWPVGTEPRLGERASAA